MELLLLIRGPESYYCGFSSYQYVFGLQNPLSLNMPEPIFFYPLEFVNNSITTPYFDLFYDFLTQKAEQLENVNITKSEKYLEIEFSKTHAFSNSKITSKQLLSINMEIGIVGFYRVDYNYIDYLNSSESESFTYEIFSEKYGSKAYRAGYENIDFILITSLSIVCITYHLRRRKK